MPSIGWIRSTLDLVATSLMILASGAMIWYLAATATGVRGPTDEARVRRPLAVENVEQQGVVVSLRGAPQIGELVSGAPVVIEYSDFECPFCQRYRSSTFPLLERDFIAKGLVYAYRHLPLANHARALPAATAAECANQQGQFWGMHAFLFQRPSLTDLDFAEGAGSLGLDRSLFATCGQNQPSRIQNDLDEARQLNITSTPTFLIGRTRGDGLVVVSRRIHGAQPIETFSREIGTVFPR